MPPAPAVATDPAAADVGVVPAEPAAPLATCPPLPAAATAAAEPPLGAETPAEPVAVDAGVMLAEVVELVGVLDVGGLVVPAPSAGAIPVPGALPLFVHAEIHKNPTNSKGLEVLIIARLTLVSGSLHGPLRAARSIAVSGIATAVSARERVFDLAVVRTA